MKKVVYPYTSTEITVCVGLLEVKDMDIIRVHKIGFYSLPQSKHPHILHTVGITEFKNDEDCHWKNCRLLNGILDRQALPKEVIDFNTFQGSIYLFEHQTFHSKGGRVLSIRRSNVV